MREVQVTPRRTYSRQCMHHAAPLGKKQTGFQQTYGLHFPLPHNPDDVCPCTDVPMSCTGFSRLSRNDNSQKLIRPCAVLQERSAAPRAPPAREELAPNPNPNSIGQRGYDNHNLANLPSCLPSYLLDHRVNVCQEPRRRLFDMRRVKARCFLLSATVSASPPMLHPPAITITLHAARDHDG